MFACVSVFGQSILSTNYSFVCGTSLHYGFIAMAIVWLSLFCIAVPALVLVAIVAPNVFPVEHREVIISSVKFLIADFKDRYKWWEVVFNVRRLIFAVIVVVVSVQPTVKILMFALFSIAFAFAQLGCWPYNSNIDNALEFSSLATIVITFVIQGYALAYGDPNNAALIFCLVVNGIMTITLLAFVLHDAIPLIVSKVFQCVASTKRKRALAVAKRAATLELSSNRSLSLMASTTDTVELDHVKTLAEHVFREKKDEVLIL
jgi:hypothetical protein